MSKHLSRADLERIGEMVASKYRPQGGRLPEPVDPADCARSVMGIDVRYCTLSRDGSILGIACFGDMELEAYGRCGAYAVRLSGRSIVIDSSLEGPGQAGRRNFTAAHELAHHVLARLYPEDYGELLGCRRHVLRRGAGGPLDWGEWQADVLGAAILMPEGTVLDCMQLFGLNEGLDEGDAAGRARMYGRFRDMAAYLGVSRRALAIRLRHMGLRGGEEAPRAGQRARWKEDGWHGGISAAGGGGLGRAGAGG